MKKWKCPEGKFLHNITGHNCIVHALALNERHWTLALKACRRAGQELLVPLQLAAMHGAAMHGRLMALFGDHVVAGEVLFPGAGYVEMAHAASVWRNRQLWIGIAAVCAAPVP